MNEKGIGGCGLSNMPGPRDSGDKNLDDDTPSRRKWSKEGRTRGRTYSKSVENGVSHEKWE